MKKLFFSFVCVSLFVFLFCACQAKSEQSGESLTRNTSAESTKKETALEWKTAYLDFLESKKDSHVSYALVYIDDDDIPELYLSGVSEADGDGICSYKNGSVVEQRLIRIGGGRYIERNGDIINQNGNMGHCYTHIYKLTDDGFALIFSALSAERIEHLGNDEYNISYEYSVDNKPVSEGEYDTAVNAAFNFAQSVQLDEDTVEYDVIKKQLMDCE